MIWDSVGRALFGPGTWGTAGNLVASVLLGAIGVVTAFLGRNRIRRAVIDLHALWARHHPHNAALAAIAEDAAAARRIAADTYEHHVGRRHPDSPDTGTQERDEGKAGS
jgi:hypothetical protein